MKRFSMLFAVCVMLLVAASAAFAAVNASSLFNTDGGVNVAEISKLGGKVTPINWGGYTVDNAAPIYIDKDGIFVDDQTGRLAKGQTSKQGPITIWPADVSLWDGGTKPVDPTGVIDADTLKTAEAYKPYAKDGKVTLVDGVNNGYKLVLTARLKAGYAYQILTDNGLAYSGQIIEIDSEITVYLPTASTDPSLPSADGIIKTFADLHNLGEVEGWGEGEWAFTFLPDEDVVFQGNFPMYRSNDAKVQNGETLKKGDYYLVVDPTAFRSAVKDLVFKQSDAKKVSLEREGFEAEELHEDTTNRPNLVTGTVIFFEAATVLPEGIQVDTESKVYANGDTVPAGWGTLRVLKDRTPVNPNPGTPGHDGGSSSGGGGGGCNSNGSGAIALFVLAIPALITKLYKFSFNVF
jgi:hypothetical protein